MPPPLMERFARLVSGLGWLPLSLIYFACVTWNLDLVEVEGGDVHGRAGVLADGDSHARMQRAVQVAENGWRPVRGHDFENHPDGTVPHTTSLLDYIIALGGAVSDWDRTAVWVSPVIGWGFLLFLWWWTGALALHPRWPGLLLACASPAMTHAFAVGRPDHQSLVVAIAMAAMACGWGFLVRGRVVWAHWAGVLWGLALWVSWFEPLVLLVVQEVARGFVLGRHGWPRPWRRALGLAAGIAAAAWVVEGMRPLWPAAEVRALFPAWGSMLGELQRPGMAGLAGWAGWLAVGGPLLLTRQWRRSKEPVAALAAALMAATLLLGLWQARWSGVFAAMACLSMPWILQPFRRPALQWALFAASLWPVAASWEARLFPTLAEQARRDEVVREAVLLRETADFLSTLPRGGVLAPWWISPALARWSGQPCVGGTSHQALPGTAAAAAFFLTGDEAEARAIVAARQVEYIVTDDPERVLATASILLGRPPAREAMATRLARGTGVPAFLEPVFANAYHRVYKVRHE